MSFNTRKKVNAKNVVLTLMIFAFILTINIAIDFKSLYREYTIRKEFTYIGKGAKGFREFTHNRTGAIFIELPEGMFDMGSPLGEFGRDPFEGPQSNVFLNSFFISKHEVTQEQWESIMRYNSSYIKGERLPVESVSWEECTSYCERSGLSLPTEAEWEYACRAGTKTPYYTGLKISENEVNYVNADSSLNKSKKVDLLAPNGWGVKGMHGNVSEWCVDSWDLKYFDSIKAKNKNPVIKNEETNYKSIRGGNWAVSPESCRSACRDMDESTARHETVGFRPVWRIN